MPPTRPPGRDALAASASNTSSVATPRAWRGTILLAALMMAVMLLRSGFDHFGTLAEAELPNPDSYYKLVLVQDHTEPSNFGFLPRDNAPDGLWAHWSLPHSWTLWQLHRLAVTFGATPRAALLWSGAALTAISMLLLSMLVAAAVLRSGTRRAAAVAALMLASSTAVLSYGRIDQITHHIFMLLPLAGAAACLLREDSGRLAASLTGGALLGLALWISPETMPFITGLIAIRASLRLQHPQSAPLWPVAAALLAVALAGWRLDPPPPSFSRWALDHISLAWLLYAALIGALALLADHCVQRRLPLRTALPLLIAASAVAGGSWLLLVPGALAGPTSLVPAELIPLWWDRIVELQSASTPARFVAYTATPLCGALLAAYAAWRQRRLWLLLLAGMALSYGLLGAWHVRMAAAAAVIAAIAFGIGISRLRAFGELNAERMPVREQIGAVLLTLAGPLQLGLTLALSLVMPDPTGPVQCSLRPVQKALSALPPATMLAPIFSGPELLYRTPHRIIAGPYHHNIEGILDNYRAWLDSEGEQARSIIERRRIGYVLACTQYQLQLRAQAPARSLAQRAADGDVPAWLTPVPWPHGVESNWRLYRVQLPPRGTESTPPRLEAKPQQPSQ